MNLPLLPQDKANHAVYGAAAAAIGLCFSWKAGVALCMLVAIGKEVYDWWSNRNGGHHKVELADTLATMAGGALVLAPQIVRGA